MYGGLVPEGDSTIWRTATITVEYAGNLAAARDSCGSLVENLLGFDAKFRVGYEEYGGPFSPCLVVSRRPDPHHRAPGRTRTIPTLYLVAGRSLVCPRHPRGVSDADERLDPGVGRSWQAANGLRLGAPARRACGAHVEHWRGVGGAALLAPAGAIRCGGQQPLEPLRSRASSSVLERPGLG